jgi:hypothetical protein
VALTPLLDLGCAANVVEGDALVFIVEEQRKFAGVDELLDRVLVLLAVDALGHQPLVLIHHQGVVAVALRKAKGNLRSNR